MVASHLIPRRGMGWGGSLMGLEIGGHQIPYWGRGRGQGKKASLGTVWHWNRTLAEGPWLGA